MLYVLLEIISVSVKLTPLLTNCGKPDIIVKLFKLVKSVANVNTWLALKYS